MSDTEPQGRPNEYGDLLKKLKDPKSGSWKIYEKKLTTAPNKAPADSPPPLTRARHTYEKETWDDTDQVRYLVDGKLLGRGGMSAVLLGYDLKMDRPVAMKISPYGGGEGNVAELEAHTVGNLPIELSTKLVQVYDYLQADIPAHYFEKDDHSKILGNVVVMEYMDPKKFPKLSDLLDQTGTFSLQETIRIMQALASVVDGMANCGVFNRDLKPHNIYWNSASGQIKLSDFGISSPVISDGENFSGTPAYMSPEAARNKPVGLRSEVFSAAQVAHMLLTGTPVFERENVAKIVSAVVSEPRTEIVKITDTRNLNTQQFAALQKIDAVLGLASAKQPEDRYESVTELVSALSSAAQDLDFKLPKRATSTNRTSHQQTEEHLVLASPGQTQQFH